MKQDRGGFSQFFSASGLWPVSMPTAAQAQASSR